MAHATEQGSRPVHLFDAWSGLPETEEQDGEGGKKWIGQVVGSPQRVQQVMSKFSIAPDRVHIHRGWFEDTFPQATIEQIALLHIDCDFFAATALCLERWYPHISPGGYIQFDDYEEFRGCTTAVNEFLERHPDIELQTFGKEGQGRAFFLQKQ